MLKVWLYAYALGVTSSRRIEQRICEDLGFGLLAGHLKPDHWTLTNFGGGIREHSTTCSRKWWKQRGEWDWDVWAKSRSTPHQCRPMPPQTVATASSSYGANERAFGNA